MTRLTGISGAAPAGPPAGMVAPTAIGSLADAAVGLRGSSTVIGLHWQSVAAGVSGFVGSLPIAGKVRLEQLYWVQAQSADPEDPHRLQIGLGSDVPTTQAELDAAEPMFPQASQLFATRYSLLMCSVRRQLVLPVSTIVKMNGRRFVAGFYNGAAGVTDVYVALVVHRVVGGAGGGDPSFLMGEPIVDV